MSEKYHVMVEAVLNKANIQKQITEATKEIYSTQSSSIKKIAGDTSKLEDQVTRWKNSLEVMAARYPSAFNTDAVQKQVVAFKGLFDAYAAGQVPQHQMITGLSNVRKEMDLARIATAEQANNVGNLGEQVASAVRKVGQWAIATTLVYGTLRAFQEAIEYIAALDKAMTNIRVVTQLNTEDTYALAQSYNALASELGVTTLEVAEGSTEWLRQGETIENTQELLKSTIMLAKLGNMTTAESTQYLISMLNGFNLEAESAIGLVDKLINLDNQYATSAAEIAEALQRSSSSARQAGVSFDQLISYITTVSSVTRKSASSIGESFKTMFARMQQVQIGAAFDEEGESISDVDKVLSRYGITLRDVAGEFRPLGDILDEIAGKWDNLGSMEQSQIATAIAGVRQRENFLTLMQNYNTALEAQGIALDSSGLAQERYALYLESVEAAANRAKAAWEGMWQKTIRNEGIKFFYNLSAVLGETLEKAGGLAPLLTIILGLLIAMKATQITQFLTGATKAMIAFAASAKSAAAGLTALNATSVIGAVIALAGVIWMVVESIETADEKAERLTETISSLSSEINQLREEKTTFEDLWKELEELSSKTELTSDESQRLLDIQNELVSILPQISGYYNEQGQFLVDLNGNYSEYIALLERELELKQQGLVIAAEERIKNQISNYQDLTSELDKLITKREEVAASAESKSEDDPARDTMIEWLKLQDQEIQTTLTNMDYAISEMVADWRILDDETKIAIANIIYENQDLASSFFDIIDSLSEVDDAIKDTGESGEESFKDLATLQEEAADAARDFASANSIAASAMEEFNNHGEISINTALRLIDAGYGEALSFNNATGAIGINTQALYQLQVAKIQVAIATQQEALAQATAQKAARETITAIENLIAVYQGLLEVLSVDIPAIDLSNVGGGGYYFGDETGGGQAEVNDLTQEYNELLRMAVAVLKQRKKEEKEALRQELEDRKELLDVQIEELETQKDALKEQLDGFKEVIDARKEALNQLKEERDYTQDIAEKNKELSDIENELLQMQYDNSQEANARRLKLEEERAKKVQEIDDLQFDHSIDLQKDALDETYDLFEEQIKQELEAIERRKKALEEEYEIFKQDIEDRIEVIDEYLEHTGRINQEALALLREGSSSFYQEMLAWNRDYGDGIDETVSALWRQREAILANAAAAREYNTAIRGGGGGGGGGGGANRITRKDYVVDDAGGIMYFRRVSGNGPSTLSSDEWLKLPAYHSGGFIGGATPQTQEVFAKLMKGEFVSTPKQIGNFLTNTLPSILGHGIGNNEYGDINLEVNLTVEGNMDKSLLPEVQDVFTDALNKALQKRGVRRNSKSYSV